MPPDHTRFGGVIFSTKEIFVLFSIIIYYIGLFFLLLIYRNAVLVCVCIMYESTHGIIYFYYIYYVIYERLITSQSSIQYNHIVDHMCHWTKK